MIWNIDDIRVLVEKLHLQAIEQGEQQDAGDSCDPIALEPRDWELLREFAPIYPDHPGREKNAEGLTWTEYQVAKTEEEHQKTLRKLDNMGLTSETRRARIGDLERELRSTLGLLQMILECERVDSDNHDDPIQYRDKLDKAWATLSQPLSFPLPPT